MVANALLIRWTGGSSWIEDATSIATFGRQERAVKLPGITSRGQAEEVGQAILALRANPRAQTSASTIPTSEAEEAFTGYNVGDLVTAPGPSGSPATLRVRSITFTESDVGDPVFSPELGDRIDELEEVLNRFLEKFGSAPATENGSGSGGDSSAYGGSDPGLPAVPAVEPEPVPAADPWVDPTLTNSTLTDPALTDPAVSGDIEFGDNGVSYHVDVPAPDDPGETSTWDIGDSGSGQMEWNFGEKADVTLKAGSKLELAGDATLSGSIILVDGGVIYAEGVDTSDPRVALLWDKIKGLFGRLSGDAGTTAVTVDGDGNWKFGQDDATRPTVDFTQANVIGLPNEIILALGGYVVTGASGVYPAQYAATYTLGLVTVGQSGTGDIVVEVTVNGSTVASLTLPGGSQVASDTIAVTVAQGDLVGVDVVDDGNGDAQSLAVFLRVV